MSKIVIALCLLAIVFFVAAQEAAAVAPKKNDLKSKLVQKIKDKVKEKIQKRGGAPFGKRPAVKLPLKEKIANLKEKLTKLKAKRDAIKARKPRSGKPASRKPRSDKPRSRKPKSQKPKSRKPRSDKPRSRKPKAEKASVKADAEFFKKIGKAFKKIAPIVKKGIQIYGKVKGMGILSESEFFDKIAQIKEKVNKYKKLLPAGLKDKLKQKLGDKIKSNPKFDKIRKVAAKFGDKKALVKTIADKLKKRFAAKKQTKTESDFGFLVGLAAKKLAGAALKKGLSKIASKKNKKSKKQPKNESESDAEFFKKLSNWWNTKGKGLFEKAKNIYAKGKQVYDVVKGFKNE